MFWDRDKWNNEIWKQSSIPFFEEWIIGHGLDIFFLELI